MSSAQGNRTNPAQDRGSDWATARRLLPYLWPRGAPQLRARMALALGLIVAAKGVTLLVPMFYKYAVDTLTKPEDAVIVVPVMLIVVKMVRRKNITMLNVLFFMISCNIKQ